MATPAKLVARGLDLCWNDVPEPLTGVFAAVHSGVSPPIGGHIMTFMQPKHKDIITQAQGSAVEDLYLSAKTTGDRYWHDPEASDASMTPKVRAWWNTAVPQKIC